MKIVDTQIYVSALRDLTEEGKTVSLKIAGNSMAPFLVHERDMICFAKPETPLCTGDMVFFQRDNGQFVMHRICRIHKNGTEESLFTYDIVGDGQLVIERGVRRDQIFARVNKARHKGKWLAPGDFLWELFAKIWPHILPLRRPILAVWSRGKKLFTGKAAGKEDGNGR